MASGTVTPPQTGADGQKQVGPNQADSAQIDHFIEDRLRQTRRQVKGVDIAGGLMTLAIGTLAYLLAAAVIDHWIVAGGLGFAGRLMLLVVLIAAATAYFVRYVLPPIRYRINPIFAAETIERSRLSPGNNASLENNASLKNSLINFLLLRSHRREVSPVVYRALQQRAASDLSQVEIEAAVDRTHVFRLGYVLVGVLAVCALYQVISPKNPLISAARVIWPFAAIDAPTRVTIDAVRPGNAAAYFGDVIEVSAEVDGLDDDETVSLHYSSDDGQIVDQVIPMTLPKGEYRHRCKLPPGEGGLRQSITYYLAGGDCKTERFSVTAQTAPAIIVNAVEYDYPEYTGIADRTVERKGGDLRAIEGTQITIVAKANREIRSAEIDFDCDGDRGLRMIVRGDVAIGQFTLSLVGDDPPRPKHESYQIRFTDASGRDNPEPIRHRIEVIRDLPPVIDLLAPEEEDVQLPEDGRLEITVRAFDPDFALHRVLLQTDAMRAGKTQTGHDSESLKIPPLLDELHEGEFEGTYIFEPADFKLVAGDRVLYWAEAEDNKRPRPGRNETARRWITIVRADSGQPQRQPGAGENPPQEQPGENPKQPGVKPEQDPPSDGRPPEEQPQETTDPRPGEEQPEEDPAQDQKGSDEPKEGEEGGDSPQAGEGDGAPRPGDEGEGTEGDSGEPSEPISETNPGDAIEKILQHQKKEQEKQAEQDQAQPGGQQDKTQPDGQQDKTQPGGQQDKTQPGGQQDKTQPGGQQDKTQPGGQQDKTQPGGSGNQPKKTPGAGEGTKDSTGSPEPQQDAQDRPKKSGDPAGDEAGKPDSPKSPGVGEKDSDSEGEGGSHKGGGDEGGGSAANKPGTGTPGTHTPDDKGGAAAKDPDGEETGPNAGNDVETDQHKGNPSSRPNEGGSERPGQPGSQGTGDKPNSQNDDATPGTPQQDPSDGGNPGDKMSEGPGAHGGGNPTTGGNPTERPQDPPPAKTTEPGGDDPDMEHARKQFDLALQHIQDQLAKEQPDQELLDSLGGMTREELAENARRWEEMRRRADQQGPDGQAARKSMGDFLKSLGLRPRGTQLQGDRTATDQLHNLRDAGRFPPPPKWAERFNQYNRGVAGSGR